MDLTESAAVRAAALMQGHSKDALSQLCRTAGWSGDDARTPKSALAEWLAQREAGQPQPEQPQPQPQPQPEAKEPAPMPEPRAARKPAPDVKDPAALIAAAMAKMMQDFAPPMDADAIRAVVADEVTKLQLPVREVRIVLKDAEETRFEEHTHPVFDKALRLLNAGANVLLKGPAGCGKSHLAAQLAKALNKDYGALHCSAGASESQLLGWLLPTGEGGRFEYVAAQFARMFAKGNALFLIDEIDAADPNFLMVLNGALANGHLHVPQNWQQPSVDRGEGFHVIAAANTYGTGADALYVGRNQLDAATIDRFYTVEMDYDRKLEAQMAPHDVCHWAWSLRERTAAAKLRRVVSTRTIQRVGLAMGAGYDFEEARRDALVGWTRDELSKVGEQA